MIQFLLQNIIMISIGIVLVLILRTLPRLEDGTEVKRGYIERLIASDLPHRLDTSINNAMGKFLRRMKVLLLKWDNILTERLKHLNREEKKIDFKELIEDEAKARSDSNILEDK